MAKYDLETLKKIYWREDTWHEKEMREAKFGELEGKTITEIHGMEIDSTVVFFVCNDGTIYKMFHEQDCCEYVYLNDICGEVDFLLDTPITLAEEVVQDGGEDDWGDTSTWTFYNFGTVKGYVTLRWLGSSNGYYSESVTFAECIKPCT